MTAQEARQLSLQAEKTAYTIEMVSIEHQIEQAVKKGLYTVRTPKISTALKDHLERDLGYGVKYFAGDPRENDDGYYTISW